MSAYLTDEELPPLPPYIYGREAEANEKVWTEQEVRQAQDDAIAAYLRKHGEPVAWALMTNGKPHSPKIRSLSADAPSAETKEIATIEGEAWVPLYTAPPLTDQERQDAARYVRLVESYTPAGDPEAWDELDQALAVGKEAVDAYLDAAMSKEPDK